MTERSMTERALQQALIDAARYSGWLVYHTYDSRRSEPGFPDLVLVHPTRCELAFIECKGPRGRVSEHQKRWLAALESAADASSVPLVQVGIANPDTFDSWLTYITGNGR